MARQPQCQPPPKFRSCADAYDKICDIVGKIIADNPDGTYAEYYGKDMSKEDCKAKKKLIFPREEVEDVVVPVTNNMMCEWYVTYGGGASPPCRGERPRRRPSGAAGANFFGGAVWGVFRENANCVDPPG